MANDQAPTGSEVVRSPSPKSQKNVQDLLVLRAIVGVIEDVVQHSVDSGSRTLTRQLIEHAADVAESDGVVELIPSILRHLELHDPRSFVTATKALADGSRNESWRSPLGVVVLKLYLDLLAKGGDHAWTIDALRLIGNCCIDSDANRNRVLQNIDMEPLFDRFESTEQQAGLVIGVLYNLCLDYEPAKQAARNHGLFPGILDVFRSGLPTTTNLLGQLCNLLDFAVEDLDVYSCPEDAIGLIYHVIVEAKPDFDDGLSLCSCILALLASERYQKLTIARGEIALITTLFIFSYTQDISTLRNADFTSALHFEQHIEEPEYEEALSELRSMLSARLWDISAQPEFALPNTLTTDLLRMLRAWLQRPQTQMQLCACSVFRNLTVSHGATADLIQQTHIHDALLGIMRNSSDIQVLEEALRLYRNLALHPNYRVLLAENGAMDAITVLWSKYSARIVQYAAARVLRQLLTGESLNVSRFLALKPQQSENPRSDDTYVAHMMHLYSSTDDLGIRIEVGQIIVAIWRVGVSQPEAEPIAIDDAIHQAKAVETNIASPVMAMITESGNPSLVTQGWLGLALMAGAKEGSIAVADVLCKADNIVVLRQTLLGSGNESLGKDGNNARIVVELLKKNHPALPEELAPFCIQ